MAGISFDDLIPGSDTISAPGISVSPPTMAADPHPMFADLIPSSVSNGNPHLPSSQTAGIPPPDATPALGDDGRSFELRRSSNATPDAPTWLGRRVQDIEGKHDTLYADVPSVFSQNRDLLQAPMGTASMLGADDDQMADVVKKQLGSRFVSTFRDANGYPIVRFKDDQGQERLGYVNKPGLDSEDVVRGVKSALPYAAAAEILGPVIGGYSLLARALFAGGSAAGVSAGGDVAMKPLGSEQGVQGAKAGTMAILGPVGELAGTGASALWQRFVQIPKYFDASTNQLTPLGKQAARAMGLDPDQMASDAMSVFGKTYAMNPADAKAAVDAGTFDFNIPATRGQIAKDPQQLLQEKAMRSGLYGLDAKNQIEDLDRRQAEAIATAVADTIPSRLAGQKWQGGQAPEVYGSNIGLNFADARKNAKSLERAAWDSTGPITPKTTTTTAADAMTPMTGVQRSMSAMQGTQLLKDTLSANLSDFSSVLSPENTPTTFKMWSYLNDFMSGRKPTSALHHSLGLEGAGDIDSVRRALGMMQKDAQTPTDQETAKAIYRGFNDWIDKAAAQNMLAGDPVGAANLKAARDVSAEMNAVFKPRGSDGNLTPGGKLLERIATSADTPERIVHALIPSPNAQIPAGTIEALNLIRKGMHKYGAPGADGQVWNSIKMAYLSKLTQGKNGQFLSPQVMSQNLRKAISSQATLFNTIYSPADKAVISRFLTQLDRVNWKDPNPSGTATSLAGLASQLFGKLLDAFGPLGRATWEYSGIQHAWGSSIARQAVKQAPQGYPLVKPNAVFRHLNALAAPAVTQSDVQLNALAPPAR
ncbi:MAG: hypothetical protein QM780_06805 [Hyphomicrobium sp.]|uniref:hypothetical protein n=1 Tax=Hyphomicrobium sp. TaxID=82 RepID=UPI0039E4B5B3